MNLLLFLPVTKTYITRKKQANTKGPKTDQRMSYTNHTFEVDG